MRRDRPPAGLLRDDKGTSLVEFAITVPFLILMALGVIEIGRYMAYSVVVGNAVRAGAQVGAAVQDDAYAAPDPNQLHSSNMDSLASQAACNDAYNDLKSGTPSFSCTSTGAAVPSNGLLITSTISCTYSDGNSHSNCQIVNGVTRTIYITVAAQGKFTTLLQYPLLPNHVPISAQTTLAVGE